MAAILAAQLLVFLSLLCYNRIVRCMNGGPTIRGKVLLLGTWVSVIAGNHAQLIRLAVRVASLSWPTLRRRVFLWKQNFM